MIISRTGGTLDNLPQCQARIVVCYMLSIFTALNIQFSLVGKKIVHKIQKPIAKSKWSKNQTSQSREQRRSAVAGPVFL